MSTVGFDTRPLTDPVDAQAAKAFWSAEKTRRPSMTAPAVVGIIIASFMALTIVPIAIVPAWMISASQAASGSRIALFAPLIVLLLFVAGAVGVILLVLSQRRARRIQHYRWAQFAAANGMTYEGRISSPPLPGMIFHLGDSRHTDPAIRGRRPRFVEFGNYRYTTGSGKDRTTHRWGYVAVKLNTPLPNIVLDALGNNTLGTNLPARFAKEQRLSLEGDFDRYFTLYCPQGYERDALYLFTPDVMARFIDHAAQLDVEIVDDWLFFYMQRDAVTLDPATWAWLFGAVGAMLSKFDQWERWRDDRLAQQTPASLPFATPVGLLTPPPGVAPQGRRLRRGTSWLGVLFVVLFAVFWMLPNILRLLAR